MSSLLSPAVVNFAPEKGSVEIREIAVPIIGDDDVLLEVVNVGVCGSDLHQWTADHSWPVNYPVVLGHEFGGLIAALGKNVSVWKEGDRVVSETAAIINPNSPMSKTGLYNLPEKFTGEPCVKCPPCDKSKPRILSPGFKQAKNTAVFACEPE